LSFLKKKLKFDVEIHHMKLILKKQQYETHFGIKAGRQTENLHVE
jgi:hypothetical protein